MPRVSSRNSSSALVASPTSESNCAASLAGLRRYRCLGRAQSQGEGDQSLLGAVVQIPLDAAPGVVGGGHDPRPRGGELGVELGVVQGDGELPGDERDGVEPVGGERAAQEPVFQQQHRPQAAPAENGHREQRAAVQVGEVRVAGEPVITGGVGHDQRFTRALHVAQHRCRQLVLVAGAADRGGAAGRCGQQPVVVVVVPEQQVDAGGAGHRAEYLDHARVQPVDAGLRAQRLRRGQDAEQVQGPGADPGAATRNVGGLVDADGRVGGWSQGGIGPVELVHLRRRPPGGVFAAGLGQQLEAGVIEAASEEEAGRPLGDQGPMPGPGTTGGLAARGIETQRGGAEIAERPGPLGLEQPQQVQEVVRRVRSAGGQPAASPRPARTAAPRAGHHGWRGPRPARASPRSRRARAVG